MLKKIKFALWVVTFVVASVASLSVVWSLVSGGLADAIRLFDLENVAAVVACLVLAGPVGFTALSLERITGDREAMRALMDFVVADRDDISPFMAQQAAGSRPKDESGGDGGTK